MAKKKKAKKVAKKKAAERETPGGMVFVTNGSAFMNVPQALYDRAKKVVGMTDNMMVSFGTVAGLKNACARIHSKSNPYAQPKLEVVPPAPVYEDKRPNLFEYNSKLESKFISQNRAQFDEANLQQELRRINRKYGPQKPVKIVSTMTFKPENGVNEHRLSAKFLVTHYEIYMR